MRKLWEKVKDKLTHWMSGRNGADQLALAVLWAGLALAVLDMPLRTGVLSVLGLLLYGYALFRTLSKDRTKRAAENWKFVSAVSSFSTKVKQRWVRVKSWRKYKYFHCPKCGALMRLSRGSGEKQMHCPRCQEDFTQKA